MWGVPSVMRDDILSLERRYIAVDDLCDVYRYDRVRESIIFMSENRPRCAQTYPLRPPK